MVFFSDDSEQAIAWNEVNNAPDNAELTGELIAAAAAYEAAKVYENYVAAHGKPASEAQAKEILGGIVAIFVDRTVETNSLDSIDAQRVKYDGRSQTWDIIAEDY
ncbi:hypothetical protein BDV39DRAFT_205426 [Aspergillus sergii]|uniref:Uncharacterized protein n=1 Tax=Aspergillus sergii TaxID=1034303 RepID=A0A5N6X1D3_9EURO|nr:hypothetical protein BDV39DRAFT_205426 [Aspergillus sergii]